MKKLYQILFIALILLTLLILAAFIVVPILERKVEFKLTQMLESEFPDAEFTLEDVGIHLITGDFQIDKFQFKDSTQKIDNVLLRGLLINNVSWTKLLRKKSLNAQDIRIDRIDIRLAGLDNDKYSEAFLDSLKKRLDFHDLKIKKFDFELNDSIEDLHINVFNGSLNFVFKNMNPDIIDGYARVDSAYYKQGGENYVYKTGAWNLNIAGNSLKGKDIEVIPQYPPGVFSQRYGRRVLRHNIRIPELDLSGFQFRELLLRNNFVASRMRLQGMYFAGFENPKMPIDSTIYKPLPQEYLRKLKQKMTIDTVQLRAGNIRYSTINTRTEKPGEIYFVNTYASLYNVTNDSGVIVENPQMVMDFMSDFMGAGRLTGSMTFNLGDGGYPYTVKCHLDKMDIAEANTITIPIVNLDIRKGENLGLDLDIQANSRELNGTIEFEYDNLSVDVLNNTENKRDKLLSWLIDKLLIKQKNTKDKSFRIGHIHRERETYRSFFSNIWRGIEDGLAETVIGAKNVNRLIRFVKEGDDYSELEELEDNLEIEE